MHRAQKEKFFGASWKADWPVKRGMRGAQMAIACKGVSGRVERRRSHRDPKCKLVTGEDHVLIYMLFRVNSCFIMFSHR